MDSSERLSGAEAIQHPYFDGLRGDESVVKNNNQYDRSDSAHPKKIVSKAENS